MEKEHILKMKAECNSCQGTGLYVGMGERDGAAVVCATCKGTGERTITIKYRDFKGRQKREGVRRIYESNPGICIGEGANLLLKDFGGMSYADWLLDRPFRPGMEDRKHTCPKWFYQGDGENLDPCWQKCYDSLGRSFSKCKYFSKKEKCWKEWDDEFAGKGKEK